MRTKPLIRGTAVALALVAVAACRSTETPRRYPIKGQILAVDTARQTITIRHEDIPGFMMSMTMTYPVVSEKELEGRAAGELVSGTLEVANSQGRLADLAHVGTAPVPVNANEIAMATSLLDVGAEVPDAAFIDQSDRRRSLAEWRGTVTAMTFIYTNCPLANFCPLMDQNFATLQNAIEEDQALKGQVRLVSISIDPAHDTPAVLAEHAAKRHANPEIWTFLTADETTTDRFAGRFGVGILRPAEGGEITHNLRTAIVNRDGRLRAIYSGNEWTPGQLLTELRTAAAAR